MLSTNRGLAKFFFLSLITFGIYGIVCMSHVASDLNKVATPRDGKHTMQYWIVCIFLTVITLGIAFIVWNHRICNRIGNELQARNIPYHIGAGTFWGWGIFGYLILVGPFIYLHKFFKAMNYLNADYNNSLSQDTAGESEQIATESSASYLPITNNITGFLNYTRIAWISLLVLLLPILGMTIIEAVLTLTSEYGSTTANILSNIAHYLGFIYFALMIVWFALLKKNFGQVKELNTSAILGVIGFSLTFAGLLISIGSRIAIMHGEHDLLLYFGIMQLIKSIILTVLLSVAFFLIAKVMPAGSKAGSMARLWAIVSIVELCISIFIGFFLLRLMFNLAGYEADHLAIHRTYSVISYAHTVIFTIIEYVVLVLFLINFGNTVKELARQNSDSQLLQ